MRGKTRVTCVLNFAVTTATHKIITGIITEVLNALPRASKINVSLDQDFKHEKKIVKIIKKQIRGYGRRLNISEALKK